MAERRQAEADGGHVRSGRRGSFQDAISRAGYWQPQDHGAQECPSQAGQGTAASACLWILHCPRQLARPPPSTRSRQARASKTQWTAGRHLSEPSHRRATIEINRNPASLKLLITSGRHEFSFFQRARCLIELLFAAAVNERGRKGS